MSEKKHLPNGKTLSKRIGQRSKASHGAPSARLQRLLTSIFNDYQSIPDPAMRDQVRHDFVFHMTDWQDDLRRLDAHSVGKARQSAILADGRSERLNRLRCVRERNRD